MEHKQAVAKALFRRAGNHSSDLVIHCKQEQRIVNELRSSGYPARRITTIKKKAHRKKEEKENKNNEYRRITILYVSGVSEEIRREMKDSKYRYPSKHTKLLDNS